MIHLRPGRLDDAAAIARLLAEYDMEAPLPPEEFLLAVEGERLAGLARLEEAGDDTYIRPIVTAPTYRGRGVGRLLVNALRQQHPQLRVVARGDAVGFYQRLGFETVPWESLDLAYQWECYECPEGSRCGPAAMAAPPAASGDPR